uniref:Ovule protein n=1 Tax=Romanomermis culicivorax TaxID=13658 RepID=A0A915I1N6_ROMCU
SNSWLPEIFLFGGKFFGGKLADYSEVIVKVLLNFGILTSNFSIPMSDEILLQFCVSLFDFCL